MSFTERFAQKADDYDTYRPKYPPELRMLLVEKLNLTPEKLVADIGSGTGISSEIFLDNGNMVFAVEPNEQMRQVAERNFDLEENFVSVAGTAENTGLNPESIDLIFAGTAFHWFDLEKAKIEFNRILKPCGNIVVAWISRDMEDALQQQVEAVFNKFTKDIDAVEKQKDGHQLADFFAPKTMHEASFAHSQPLDSEAFLGRLRSSSYYPQQGDAAFEQMTAEMVRIFETFEHNGTIDFKYITKVFWA